MLLSPLRILLVDDEVTYRDVIASYLMGEGHVVTTAANGQEAVNLFDRDACDLVITDRNMPLMQGDELAANIKSRSPEVPVLLVTGSPGPIGENGVVPYVDSVLRKPFRLPALSAAILAVVAAA